MEKLIDPQIVLDYITNYIKQLYTQDPESADRFMNLLTKDFTDIRIHNQIT